MLKDAGVVDAGGAGFLLLLDAALHVVDDEPLPETEAEVPGGVVGDAFDAVAHRVSGVDGELDVSEQRYEVMFLCNLADADIGALKEGWGRIGDSIVVVGGDGVWNCHVHTNDIGAAIETALDLDGRPFKIRVTDLFEEVAAEHASRESELAASMGGGRAGARRAPCPDLCGGGGEQWRGHRRAVPRPWRAGRRVRWPDGESVHRRATRRRRAGQRQPGRPAPRQQEHHPGCRTGRFPHHQDRPGGPGALDDRGLAALMAYDPEVDAPANVLPMRRAAEAVVTGEVTRAVRSSKTPAGPVAEGDWLGIVRGDGIVAIGGDVAAATKALLEHLVDDDRELITLITGSGAEEDVTAELSAWIGERFPDVELEVHPAVNRCIRTWWAWSERASRPEERMSGVSLRELDGHGVGELRGVGERKRDALKAFGIETVLDLLMTYPRRWVDRTNEARGRPRRRHRGPRPGDGPLGAPPDDTQPSDHRRGSGRRRHRAPARRLLQPTVARTASSSRDSTSLSSAPSTCTATACR